MFDAWHQCPHESRPAYAVINAGVDPNRPGQYPYYVGLDDVLRLNMPFVRKRIANPFGSDLPLIHRWPGQYGDAHTDRGFRRARQHSWAMAQLLARADTESERAQIKRAIEERAAIAGKKILGLRNAAA